MKKSFKKQLVPQEGKKSEIKIIESDEELIIENVPEGQSIEKLYKSATGVYYLLLEMDEEEHCLLIGTKDQMYETESARVIVYRNGMSYISYTLGEERGEIGDDLFSSIVTHEWRDTKTQLSKIDLTD